MTTDVQADRAIDDPRAAFERALGDNEPRVRVIGPASGGVQSSTGKVAFISAIGPLAPRLTQAIGPELGVAIDIGLAWDLHPAELIPAIIDAGYTTLGLALPESHFRDLAPTLQAARGRVAVFALATSLAPHLAPYDVATVPDLGSLVRALSVPSAARPRGRRVAVVTGTGPLAAFVAPAFEAAQLRLTTPSQATIDHLTSELPAHTRMQPFIQIPGATERHAALAVESVRSDLRVEHVFAFDLPGFPARDPHLEAAHLAALATASTALAKPASEVIASEPPTRAATLVAATLLMRRNRLGHAETTSLLASIEPALSAAPSQQVANVAHAINAARRLGYPVLLDAEPVVDEAHLLTQWESLAIGAYDRHAGTESRRIQSAPEATIEVTYAANPMPTAIVGTQSIALPARACDLAGPLAPLVRALSSVSSHLPHIASLRLVTRADQPVIVHAEAHLAPENQR